MIPTVMKYKIVLYRSEKGITVGAPLLPGCWSGGYTEEEALTNIQDAMSILHPWKNAGKMGKFLKLKCRCNYLTVVEFRKLL
ncbi:MULTISPECIES: type II toxin-antitoxin system HicB family antitoxin [unclassified Microcystis]|uniref:type II toxin-antitoxin system HicB family antitoxin n=1 Tax=unclassified Microcystis TaxID=2643300 RepID=UPI002589A424|nr:MULTISPECIES: type II toxin-antitoxin system HicB family antitoxin [unclassified Microcystis]